MNTIKAKPFSPDKFKIKRNKTQKTLPNNSTISIKKLSPQRSEELYKSLNNVRSLKLINYTR